MANYSLNLLANLLWHSLESLVGLLGDEGKLVLKCVKCNVRRALKRARFMLVTHLSVDIDSRSRELLLD